MDVPRASAVPFGEPRTLSRKIEHLEEEIPEMIYNASQGESISLESASMMLSRPPAVSFNNSTNPQHPARGIEQPKVTEKSASSGSLLSSEASSSDEDSRRGSSVSESEGNKDVFEPTPEIEKLDSQPPLETFLSKQLQQQLKYNIRPLAQDGKKREACRILVSFLIDRRIRCLATDFDLTMTSIHSGGSVNMAENSSVLTSLTEDFKVLGEECMRQGLRIVVVTFSDGFFFKKEGKMAGEKLVREVMKRCDAKFDVEAVYGFYPELYSSKEAYTSIGLGEPMAAGKSFHLKKVCEDFSLQRTEVFLLDDDPQNCAIAAKEGYLVCGLLRRCGLMFENMSANRWNCL